MKAAVLHGPFDLRVDEVKTPVITDSDVLVKVRRAGICSTDLDLYKRWKAMPFWEGDTRPADTGGRMIGHEFYGDIVEMGPKAKASGRYARYKVGDHIAGAGSFNCMAEYIRLAPDTAVAVHKVPDDLSEEEGCLVERLTTAWGAFEGGGKKQGETSVVIGMGGIGLCLVQMLSTLTQNRVIAVDVSDRRLALAKQFGAQHTVNPTVEDPREKIAQLTGSIPVRHIKPAAMVDSVYDCVGFLGEIPGVAPALVQALEIVRPNPRPTSAIEGSQIVMVGAFEKPVPLDLLPLLLKRTKIIGTNGGSPEGIDECFNLMKEKKLNFNGLVSHVFPLDRVKEAFETAMRPKEALQVQLKP